MRRPSALQCHTAGLAAAFIALVAGMAAWTARDHIIDVCADAVVTHATKMDIFNRQNVPQVRDFIDMHGAELLPRIGAKVSFGGGPTVAAAAATAASRANASAEHARCVEQGLWGPLRQRLASACGNATDPILMMQAFRHTGLHLNPVARNIRGVVELLSTPVAWAPLFERAGDCVAGNVPLTEYVCEAVLHDPSIGVKFKTGADADKELCYTLNQGMLVQRLTEEAVRFPHIWAAFSNALEAQALWITEAWANIDWGHDAARRFVLQKYHSVGMRQHRGPVSGPHILSTNILEAARFDLEMGGTDNVALGLTLAHYSALVQPPYQDEHGRTRWDLGKDWVDAYNAWDLNLITHFPDGIYPLFMKLLIPAVGCADFDFSNADVPNLAMREASLYILARTISLKLVAHSIFLKRNETAGDTPSKSLVQITKAGRKKWAEITAAHTSLPVPAVCGIYSSAETLLEGLYPRDGFPMPLPRPGHGATFFGFDHFFRVREKSLKLQPTARQWLRSLVVPMMLAGFVTTSMIMLEQVINRSGLSAGYTAVVVEAFIEVAKGVPLILAFLSHDLLGTLVFLGCLWHFGLAIGNHRPSAVLELPLWSLPPERRTKAAWLNWAVSLWTCVHHFVYTTVKLALTYDVAHNRPCSQPALLVAFVLSVATAHTSYGLGKLSHMGILDESYGTLSEYLLFTGFATRMFAAVCICFLSAPHSPATRGPGVLAHLFVDNVNDGGGIDWGFTHTEWHYFMLGDIVWCTVAIFLKVLGNVVPADAVEPGSGIERRNTMKRGMVVSLALNYGGRPKKLGFTRQRASSRIRATAAVPTLARVGGHNDDGGGISIIGGGGGE